jgi:hypothetical protein
LLLAGFLASVVSLAAGFGGRDEDTTVL